MQTLGTYSIPIIIALAGAAILFSKENLFSTFLKGTRTGISTTFKLLPTLVILLCATKMFSASGALDILCSCISRITHLWGIPDSVIPLILIRPISGSASTAMISEIYQTVGPDSFAGRFASIIMGSTDTIIYTLAMYFGAAGIKRTRYALPASFIILTFCVFLSLFITNVFF